MKQSIFISSVQKEFTAERQAIHHHLMTDPLLQLFFEPVLFEKLPAGNKQAQTVYLDEVAAANVYLILVGKDYGYQDSKGVSPTELEYDWAQKHHLPTLAFIKEIAPETQHEKEKLLLLKIQDRHTYKRFSTTEELTTELTKALIAMLQDQGTLQNTDFDAASNDKAELTDIDEEKVNHFISLARYKRGFPFREGTALPKVLSHLNFLSKTKITNSALLAFGKNTQHFFPTAVVKCAHFHGTQIAKPIPDHRVIKGDVFSQVDETIDFILSKTPMSVGTRAESNQAPLDYEIPRAVVAEAVVNAIAHRNYQSNGSVQVMLFADRLEISNPGSLPPELTLDKLKTDHSSYPKNPHLAEVLYQAGYIERFGTGTGEILRLCLEAGLAEPLFTVEEGFKVTLWRSATAEITGQPTGQLTGQVPEAIKRVVFVIDGEVKTADIMETLNLKHRESFRDTYLLPALAEGFIEMKFPDSPNHPQQRYRLTDKGRRLKSSNG